VKLVRHPEVGRLRALAQQWLGDVREQLAEQQDPAEWFHGYFLDRFCQHRDTSDPGELYPTLLSWRVHFTADFGQIDWVESSDRQRKRLGSYYTPECLIECLLQTTLDPLLAETNSVEDVLRLTICDPACGSGRLLIAAGERLVRRLRTLGMEEAEARREVVARCLFGMDCDQRAVEMCRNSFVSQDSDPDIPNVRIGILTHVRHGNSLLADWPQRFAVVLVNPPWDRVKVESREWLTQSCDIVAQARHDAQTLAHLLRTCGRFPLSARGDLNVYPLFVELARDLLDEHGRAGLIVPSGLASQMATQPLFADLLDKKQLVSWFDFSNRRRLFPAVQGNVKFALLTLSKRPQAAFSVAAQLEHPDDRTDRVYTLTASELARLNPETQHLPSARTASDVARLLAFHDRFSPLSESWPVTFETMFHMTNDAHHFVTDEKREVGRSYWPLYEAKLVHQYNHRHATFAGVPAERRFGLHAAPILATPRQLNDPAFQIQPRYWVEAETAIARAGDRPWFLTLRNAISATADVRSLVAALLPPQSAIGNSLVIARLDRYEDACLLLALLNSLVLDYVVKHKASGSNLNFHILRQLPLPSPGAFEVPSPWSPAQTLADWLRERVLELTHCGVESRRFRLRCEIDAAILSVYGVNDIDALLKSFPVLERRERREFGRFRTAEIIGGLLPK